MVVIIRINGAPWPVSIAVCYCGADQENNVRQRWFFHPITIFIFSILALGASLFLYLYWYLSAQAAFNVFVVKYKLNTSEIFETKTVVIILTLSTLVTAISISIGLIFLYYQKLTNLYLLQQNFINGFTHELKTPIASLRLYLETFKRYKLSREEELKYLDYMMVDADRLSNNVNQILQLAKIEDKKYNAEFKRINLEETIRDLLDKSCHMFPMGNLSFEVSENENWNYPVNPILFELLVMNLVSNGIIHNPSKNKEVKVKLTKIAGKIRIVVSDNGLGIEPREIKKVFKKFYQVKNASKGSGIGLFLVQNIVKIMKGTIRIECDGLGKGTSFIVELPPKDLP